MLARDLKCPHNEESQFYGPQTFLNLDFQCKVDVFDSNRRVRIKKSCMLCLPQVYHGNVIAAAGCQRHGGDLYRPDAVSV